MTDRQERFEVRVEANPQRVWEMLTTSEGLRAWFGTRATIELRIGGERVVDWGGAEAIVGRVEDVEPPRRLRIVYVADGDEVGAEEWLIAGEEGTTRLTLVHTLGDEGVDDWEGYYGDIARGWRLFLASLRFALAGAQTPYRRADSTYLADTRGREEIWRDISGWRRSRPTQLAGLKEALSDPPHSLLLTAVDRSLLIDVEGAGATRAVYVQAATHDGPAAWRREVMEELRQVLGQADQ